MECINLTGKQLKDAFKVLRVSIRRDNVWHVSVGEYTLRNCDELEHGRVVYQLNKGNECLLRGTYSTFKRWMDAE